MIENLAAKSVMQKELEEGVTCQGTGLPGKLGTKAKVMLDARDILLAWRYKQQEIFFSAEL